MWSCKPWIFLWLFCVHFMLQSEADINLANHKLSGLIQWKYEKRPFCNAFTGCGKKRASYTPYPLVKRNEIAEKDPVTYDNNNTNNEDMAEGLSDLIDINAEPAVENVQKQIMSQAKIFEAIKEASKEIFRQRNKQKLRNQQHLQALQQQQELEKLENGEGENI